MELLKYHGLGNDYLVLDARYIEDGLSEESVVLLCSRHYGAGSDGILTGPFMPGSPDFQDILEKSGADAETAAGCLCALRILNPDGSEAEKSGNGLRIFSRYLFDLGMVELGKPFSLLTLGGVVTSSILDPDKAIRVDMGQVVFNHPDFPRQISGQLSELEAAGEKFQYMAASVGNPHCVVFNTAADEECTVKYGPVIEKLDIFPRRINVQFIKVLGEHDIFISIWERGAGYTLASGSSASAAAAVSVITGNCESPVNVHSPGGVLTVEVQDGWKLVQTGPVELVCSIQWLGKKL